MSDAFPRAIRFVLAHEGGLGDHPDDPGGLTNHGVSARAYPGLEVAALTGAQAVALYRRDYWDKLRLGDLPAPVALAVFDAAVNCGRATAALMLQRAYNRVGAWGRLEEDGWLGPLTRTAIQTLGTSHPERVYTLAHRMLLIRARFYADLAKQRRFATFLRGWVLRVADLADELDADLARPQGPASKDLEIESRR
ncbi:MAG: glycoside hydrolase family 108 protein [Thermodesulfobacteriota bacterium]